ncbi:MAG: hypothetical protein WCG25_01560 [bacterium]
MKTLFVIIALVVVALFSSCKKETITNRFVTFGDYTFEVLSDPDEYGDIKVKIQNTEKIGFDYYETFGDVDAIKRWAYSHMYDAAVLQPDSVRYPSSRIIKIHKASGLTILEAPFTSFPKLIKIFESAEEFFAKKMPVDMPMPPKKSSNITMPCPKVDHTYTWRSAYDPMVDKFLSTYYANGNCSSTDKTQSDLFLRELELEHDLLPGSLGITTYFANGGN